jgi:hypothetical protein
MGKNLPSVSDHEHRRRLEGPDELKSTLLRHRSRYDRRIEAFRLTLLDELSRKRPFEVSTRKE